MLSPKPWKMERVVWLMAALLASVSLGTLVVQGYQWALSKDDLKGQPSLLIMLVGTLTFHGVALVLVGVFLREHQITWRGAFGFNAPRRGRAILLAVFTCIIVLPIAWSLGELSQLVLLRLGRNPVAQQSVQALQTAASTYQQIYFGLVAVFLAPFVEEIVFRGIIYPSIKQMGYPTAALWATSLLFAFTHANLMTFVPLTVLAVILTFLYETTDNLLAPIVAHALFNATNFAWLLQQAPPGSGG